jgi:hypothetical protein
VVVVPNMAVAVLSMAVAVPNIAEAVPSMAKVHLMEEMGTGVSAGLARGAMVDPVHGIMVDPLHGEIADQVILQTAVLHLWIRTGKEGSHQKVDSLQTEEDGVGSFILIGYSFHGDCQFLAVSFFHL